LSPLGAPAHDHGFEDGDAGCTRTPQTWSFRFPAPFDFRPPFVVGHPFDDIVVPWWGNAHCRVPEIAANA
jgi:hypothetical protein